MIAKLRGILDSSGDDYCLVDVGGVGYLVYASGRTLSGLPPVGEDVVLLIDTHVREDHIHLYGFRHELERDWFRLLQSVQGVGAKVALTILSTVSPDELTAGIAAQDKTVVARAKGVGPKMATRIVNELKDKVAKLAVTSNLAGAVQSGDASIGGNGGQDNMGSMGDAVSALTNLGYRPAEALQAVSRAAQQLGGNDDLQGLIRVALQELSQ
ncbi:MAG: Holliday junction branch migration protein RuvA [Kordiimonas sp.]|nr:Holliday junction branch migration protein RuvA [Kordiimonas sp.]